MNDQSPAKWGLSPEDMAGQPTVFAPDLLAGQRFRVFLGPTWGAVSPEGIAVHDLADDSAFIELPRDALRKTPTVLIPIFYNPPRVFGSPPKDYSLPKPSAEES